MAEIINFPIKAPHDACEWCGGGNAYAIASFDDYFICRRCYSTVSKARRDEVDAARTFWAEWEAVNGAGSTSDDDGNAGATHLASAGARYNRSMPNLRRAIACRP
jgi:hypothetical protein